MEVKRSQSFLGQSLADSGGIAGNTHGFTFQTEVYVVYGRLRHPDPSLESYNSIICFP